MKSFNKNNQADRINMLSQSIDAPIGSIVNDKSNVLAGNSAIFQSPSIRGRYQFNTVQLPQLRYQTQNNTSKQTQK